MAASSSSSVHYFCSWTYILLLVQVFFCTAAFVCRLSEAQLLKTEILGSRKVLLSLDQGSEHLPTKKKTVITDDVRQSNLQAEALEHPKSKKNSAVAEEEKKLKKQKLKEESDEKSIQKRSSVQESGITPTKKKKSTNDYSDGLHLEKKESAARDLIPKKKKAPANELAEKIVKQNTLHEADYQTKKTKLSTTEVREAEQAGKIKRGVEVINGTVKKDTSKAKSAIEDQEEFRRKKKSKKLEEEDELPKKKTKAAEVEAQPKKTKITTGSKDQKKLIKPFRSVADSAESKSTLSKSDRISTLAQLPLLISDEKNVIIQNSDAKLNDSIFGSEDDSDLSTDFTDLSTKFQSDLERISTTSRSYLNKANREISQSFKPLVGSKYASAIASISSYMFLFLPFIVIPVLYARIRNYFMPLQTILVFVQIYLSIYFSILSFSFLVTGLEPLKFFYATSKASYVYTQVLQTLAYVLYLMVQVMYLMVVFSPKGGGRGSKLVVVAQTAVGVAVGVHYYVSVFHRAVASEAPMTNWKIHAVYASSFLAVCLFARADREKKAYVNEGQAMGNKLS